MVVDLPANVDHRNLHMWPRGRGMAGDPGRGPRRDLVGFRGPGTLEGPAQGSETASTERADMAVKPEDYRNPWRVAGRGTLRVRRVAGFDPGRRLHP